ncbi:16S rRNA (cytidine(1402)-2'-O)-methyltransferase, partial [Candidatus Uhrbacteria bacterium]|nr:16S rRNA (cytidine(1402)-2'-O)-methyltransferase [Candidatus Uhrbacteria bacterium]
PIGNLEDITMRALRTLRECDVIMCEDTRVTAKLLARYEIRKPLQRCDSEMVRTRREHALAPLRAGQHVAYVCDAGTPGVSDPGPLLVKTVLQELPEVPIESIPGPSALTTFVSMAGIRVDRFTFLGFLPLKKHRKEYLQRIGASEESVIFYESTHRIMKTLRELLPVVGDRTVVVGRELTKLHETWYRGTATDVTEQLQRGSMKGEFVVGVAGVRTRTDE